MNKTIAYVEIEHFICQTLGNRLDTLYVDKGSANVLDEKLIDFSSNLDPEFSLLDLKNILPLINGLNLNIEYISKNRFINRYLEMLNDLIRYFPNLENHDLGKFYLDLTYLINFDTEKKRTLGLISKHCSGLRFNFGVGHNKWLAFLSAKNLISKSGIKDVSVDFLPVKEDVRERLKYFDLNSLGDIASIGVEKIHHQFGETGLYIWNLANGIADDFINPIKADDSFTRIINFNDPVNDVNLLTNSLEGIVKEIFEDKKMIGRAYRAIMLKIYLENGKINELKIHSKEVFYDRYITFKFIRNKLINFKFLSRVSSLEIIFNNMVSFHGTQIAMFKRNYKESRLNDLVLQLKEQFGKDLVYSIKEIQDCSMIPEKRFLMFPIST